MPTGAAILAAAGLGIAIWAGGTFYTHAVKPAGCAIAKVATLGHKVCKPKK